jgi:hypothetical protein|nr:PepSY domain-containing protein [uncultured Lachnoanaerobaculum sp.]
MKKLALRAALFAATLSTTGVFALTSFAANPRISRARAKEIAVAQAGLPASSVRFTKVKLDYEKGRYEYEIEFRYNGYEYDVELDANTGAVLDYDVEYDD